MAGNCLHNLGWQL